MGNYATTTSLPNLLPGFLKGNSTTTDPQGVAMFGAHITRAESVVNAACVARYGLPFVTIPPLVRTLSEDIAAYFLIRGSYVQDGEIKQSYVDSYDWAIDQLEKIRKGEIKLSLTDGTLIPAEGSRKYLSSSENYSPVFNMDEPTSWDINTQQAEDVADTRT